MEDSGVIENITQFIKLEKDIDENKPSEAILKKNNFHDTLHENNSHGDVSENVSSIYGDKEHVKFDEKCSKALQESNVKESYGMRSEGEKYIVDNQESDKIVFQNSTNTMESDFNEQNQNSLLFLSANINDCIITEEKKEPLAKDIILLEQEGKQISDAVNLTKNEQLSASFTTNKDDIAIPKNENKHFFGAKQDEPYAGQSWYVNDGEEELEDGVSETDESYDGEYTDDEEQNSNRIQNSRRRRVGEQSSDDEGVNEELSEGECQEVSDDEEGLDERAEGKRFSGDGQEEPKMDKNLVDEDRKNPAYVPRKGTYFEHDLRAHAEDDCDRSSEAKTKKKSRADDGKWKHDKFDIHEQAPKRTHEIVRKYGFDIRKTSHLNKNHVDSDEFHEDYNQTKNCLSSNKEHRNLRYVARNNCRRDVNDIRSASPHTKHDTQKYDNFKKDRSDISINKSRPRDPKRNRGPVRRGLRTEIIATGDKRVPEVQVKVDLELHNRNEPSFNREDRRTSPKKKDDEKNSKIGPNKIVKESNYKRHLENQNLVVKSTYAQKLCSEDVHDGEQGHALVYIGGKGNYRKQEQSKSFRELTHQRPPRLTKQFADRPPREFEIINNNVMRGRIQNKKCETHPLSYCEKEKTKNISTNDFDNSTTISSATPTQHLIQTPMEGRKGWAGGEFTPSWRSDPQQRRSEETNTTKASKRYSSSRQQKQYHEVEYYQQYPPYNQNSPIPSGPVYDAMIPHPAFVPHSTLVTNSYAPFYSTLPGNVYPNPPVYQQPQLAPYTNTSYVNHEGPVFYGHQGVPQYFEPPQTLRATSAIPIVNPQDFADVQKNGSQLEAVAICSQ